MMQTKMIYLYIRTVSQRQQIKYPINTQAGKKTDPCLKYKSFSKNKTDQFLKTIKLNNEKICEK